MTLPCTKQQFEALGNLFNQFFTIEPAEIKKRLAFDLAQPIKQKLNSRKPDRTGKKKSWNLKLTDLQTKTYYTIFHGRHLGPDWHYESNFIEAHLLIIEKHYGL